MCRRRGFALLAFGVVFGLLFWAFRLQSYAVRSRTARKARTVAFSVVALCVALICIQFFCFALSETKLGRPALLQIEFVIFVIVLLVSILARVVTHVQLSVIPCAGVSEEAGFL